MEAHQIAIYGGGGFAREVAWLAQACNINGMVYELACFIDDNESAHNTELNAIPVMSLATARKQFPHARIVHAVGAPTVRQQLVEKSAAAGWEAATVIHPRVERSEWIDIGVGTVICAGSILTTNIVLGRYVQINLGCTIGHDVVMDDYATLAPGVHISGCVHIGKRAYIGTGAVIINGTQSAALLIGDDAVVGAGACVTKSVPSGITVAGVPAKPLQRS